MDRNRKHVRITDTKNKTGDVELVFDRAEWEAFIAGVIAGEFGWDRIEPDTSDDRPMTERERAALIGNGARRTPENIAYVNGRHAERSGWVPYTFTMFCRRFKVPANGDTSFRLYESFQTGRRAEALEASVR